MWVFFFIIYLFFIIIIYIFPKPQHFECFMKVSDKKSNLFNSDYFGRHVCSILGIKILKTIKVENVNFNSILRFDHKCTEESHCDSMGHIF